jgi:hypothetical protein
MREKMRNGEVKLFYIPATKREDVDLTAELNIEKYELMKTGHLRFSHPEGGHDDVFWSMLWQFMPPLKRLFLAQARSCFPTDDSRTKLQAY